ncbi:MAG: hypothetical protein ACI9WU_003608 [Myxococcota bacterium]|jgi:hypothetical protein
MNFEKKATVSASAEKIWSVFAHDFDNAHKWMASIPHSYGKEVGAAFDGAETRGRVCELGDPSGMKASEQFLAYDEDSKTCTVRIDFLNTPAVFPIRYNTLDFAVVDRGDNQSEMTFGFSSEIKPLAYLIWPLIRLGFGVFVGQIMEELQFYVENGTPHPRKVKALGKAKLAGNA